jgi:hypothetical protein
MKPALLTIGFVSAQSQVYADMIFAKASPMPNLGLASKLPAPNGYSIF